MVLGGNDMTEFMSGYFTGVVVGVIVTLFVGFVMWIIRRE